MSFFSIFLWVLILFYRQPRVGNAVMFSIIVSVICGVITFVGACIYSVGVKSSIDIFDNKSEVYSFFLKAYDRSYDAVVAGMGAAWYTSLAWILYLAFEFFMYLRYGSELTPAAASRVAKASRPKVLKFGKPTMAKV